MESLKESGILTNFLGAITDSLVKEGYNPDDVRHLIVASLMEIVEDETKNADGSRNFYALKPVLRFCVNLYQEENNKMQPEAYLPAIQKKMQDNDKIVQFFMEQIQAVSHNLEEQK